jgi:mannosyltransferase OCH1-like enzyme
MYSFTNMSIKSLVIPKLNQPSARVRLDSVKQEEFIPRIFHQTFYDRTLPGELQTSVSRLVDLHPGWEYRFYDDDGIAVFIQKNYPAQVWDYFQRIDPRYGAARADLFRYLLMYKVGGVYLDIKSAATQCLDTVLHKHDKFILSQWNIAGEDFPWGQHSELRNIAGGEFQQWFIASAPGHPYLKAVIEAVFSNIDEYDPILHGVGKYGVLRVTGPIAYTLAIARALQPGLHRQVESNKELGLVYNVYSGQSHQTTFRSHYSLQTMPIVQQRFAKRQMTRVFSIMQAGYHLVKRNGSN